MSKAYIVMIEDNPAEVTLLRMALEQHQEPFELAVLSDGAEALRFVSERHTAIRSVKHSEEEPCVVLLDLHLPKYDGLEVLAAMRREPRLSHIPVVILTSGEVRPEEAAKIRSHGALFREKPRQFSEVLQLAADVLELCKSSVEQAFSPAFG